MSESRDYFDPDVRQQMEAEANHFACCLLMPRDLVVDFVTKSGGMDLGSDDFLKKFCEKFQVPMNAAVYRLADIYRHGRAR